MKQCLLDDCAGKIKGRGFCAKHYARLMRNGSPHIVSSHKKKTKYSSLKEYLEVSFEVNLESGCWEWTKSKESTGGYGSAWWLGRHAPAHRLSYMHYSGEIPEGMCVLHKCDNRICLNPKHLFLGTYLDNNRDRAKKNRSADTSGQKNPFAKLTDKNVIDIKRRLKKGDVGKEIARMYHVSVSTISKINRNINWAHLIIN